VQHQEIETNEAAGGVAGRTTGRTSEASEAGHYDPDLARLVAAWPTLSDVARRLILAALDTVGPK
jgi:hypothetical protein